jgi:hypothetical protein
MSILANQESFSGIVERWLKAEENGEQFPVEFDIAWQIAGYRRKDIAKRKLTKLSQGNDFHQSVEMVKRPQGGGAKVEIIQLTCDAFKHFCLLAETEQGDQIRQYFIEAEKKWKLVQTNFPQVASEVEMMQLKIELAGLEAQKEIAIAQSKASELAIFHFRQNLIKLELPQVIEQKILGYQTIETVEYRDRVILNNQVINEGDTLNKSELCHRYKILTKNGKPDYRRLNTILDRNGITERSEAWEMSAVIQENYQFKREYLADLDKLMINDDRQLFIGE